MGMMPFRLFFPELARGEMRVLRVLDVPGLPNPSRLPVDEYGFEELYCVDRDCDCRRVMLSVHCASGNARLATINHAFEPPTQEWDPPEQTFLDPLNAQSPLAPKLLDAFKNVVLKDEAYAQRLVRHYQMVKDGIADAASNPRHPWHEIIRGVRAGGAMPPGGGVKSLLPPKRRGIRKWR